uniref:PH domain-containing protein n=1 Tax=Caenorhabditis japonica TaxID=281687 RepID=A0A8R1HZH1_CAEJA
MYRRETFVYPQPPMLKSPAPTSSPLDSNRSYRWTSMTAANNSRFAETPVKSASKKPDTSWWSPSHGDTWRLNAPRGRTLDLVAAFDQCARQEEYEAPKYANVSRYRRNSEPMHENDDRELVTTNFIDDSMIEDHHEEYEEHDIELDQVDTDYYDRPVTTTYKTYNEDKFDNGSRHHVEQQTQVSVTNDSRRPSVTSSYATTHRSSVDHVIGYGDVKPRFAKKIETPILEQTPKRPQTKSARPSLDMGRLDQPQETVAGFITSTPQVHKGNEEEPSKVFGNEESIRRSARRERRRTQTIALPSFDSPASARKFKSPMAPPPPVPVETQHESSVVTSPSSLVKSIANEFEKADFGFHRKIDPAQEIAELRKQAESSQNSTFDENRNFVNTSKTSDVSNHSVPRISRFEMRPSIQMGVTALLRNRESPSQNRDEDDEEVLYSVPVKKTQKKGGTDETDEKQASSPHRILKATRESLPFSDIPEERTCDKIDEMFDFVEVPTGDFTEKTLDRTLDGYAELLSRGSPAKRAGNRMDMSANTYQEIEFEKDVVFQTTPYVEQFENDGTAFSGGSASGPQFTRSPTLITPHAGQSVTEYRVSEKEGQARTEKVVVQKMSQPSALATSTPKGTFAWRKNQSTVPEDSFVSSISNFSSVDKINDSRRQISKLIETIEKTRKHIQLAEISLLDAKRARMVVQELASQRVLLICRERLKLQLDEVRRLQALSVVRHPPPPINRHFKSAMVISNIAVHLNKNFNCRGSFAFIVALKCRTEIEATGVVTLLAHYQTRMHVIHFGEHMHFSNLPVDFVVSMEVYMMRVPEYKAPEKTCASLLAAKVRSLLVPNSAHRRSKPNSISANRTVVSLPGYQAPECEFKFCGKLTLDRDSAGDRQFYLDDVTYPLEGTVKLVSHCSSLPEAIDVEYRGFLYLFDERSPNGDSAWERYWAMLHRGIIFFWKNPVDEKNEQVPLSQIDLTKCTNQSIEETRNERSHEFHIELLIDQTPSLLEKRRVILAAESSDHLASWLNAINDTLYVLRS